MAQHPDSLLEEIYEALEADALDRAEKAIEALAALDGGHADLPLVRADLAVAQGKADAAIELLTGAYKKTKQEPLIGARLAFVLLDAYEDVDAALPLLEDAAKGGRARVGQPGDEPLEEDVDFLLEVLLTLADCRAAVGDPEGALDVAKEATTVGGDDPFSWLALASAAFDLCDFDAAEEALSACYQREPDMADALWLEGRLHMAHGEFDEANARFAKAVARDDERFSAPFRVDDASFAGCVADALSALPAKLKTRFESIDVKTADVPSLERLGMRVPPLSPGCHGLFDTVVTSGRDDLDALPAGFTVYKKNVEIDASDRADLVDAIATTILHESAAALGLDEDALDTLS